MQCVASALFTITLKMYYDVDIDPPVATVEQVFQEMLDVDLTQHQVYVD